MTKEEAINLLRANVMVACDTSDKVGYGTPLNKAIEDALNMAIKALEQQPCDDCVSRKQALSAIRNLYPSTPFVGINLKKWQEENKKYSECEDIIKSLPPVTPAHCFAEVRFSKEELREICNERIEIECTHGTCRDCRHREGIDLDACFCAKHGNSAKDDFYCKDFEMRGNENGTDNNFIYAIDKDTAVPNGHFYA